MGTHHGVPAEQKPIQEVAAFIKNIIPADIPETYPLKPIFEDLASGENIRNGILAFRDFLYVFCDHLISEGHLYVRPLKKPKSATDYPFLYHVTDLLVDMGYYGELAESGDSLLVTEIPSFTTSFDGNGNSRKPKNPASQLLVCLRFLSLCGFVFTGIDLDAKPFRISEVQALEVSYPAAPLLLTGLVAMSIADMELRVKRYKNDNNHDNLLRCDYRLLKEEDTDSFDLLKDFLHSLPKEVQKFALEMHQHYTAAGMTCATMISTFETHFAYSSIKKSPKLFTARDIYQRRVWEFALSIRYGYCLVIRAKKTDEYADIIETFPLSLQEKIAQGYGCDRKLRNEPCQNGCQGLRFTLDDSILKFSRDIITWLDNELSH